MNLKAHGSLRVSGLVAGRALLSVAPGGVAHAMAAHSVPGGSDTSAATGYLTGDNQWGQALATG